MHSSEGFGDHARRRTKQPNIGRRYINKRKKTARRITQRIDLISKWIVRHATDLNARPHDSVPTVQGGDGIAPPTPDRYCFVTARHPCILVKLHDSDGDRVGRFRDRSIDETRNPSHRLRRKHIIRIMLLKIECTEMTQFRGLHSTM